MCAFFFGVDKIANIVTQFDPDIALGVGALAANTAILTASKFDASRNNGFRVVKARGLGQISAKTAAEGPLIWGLCANCDAAAVKAIMEADPQDSTQDDAKGAGQWVKPLGLVKVADVEALLPQDGKPFDIKVNWSVIEGQTFNFFVYNMGATITTGASFFMWLELMGVWLRD